jgi:segregation and condensation protein A
VEVMEIDSNIINHLLFHKALLDENIDTSRIDRYVEIVKQSKDGTHISISDPFDKSIAIAFELVIKQHLDPWNIDLVKFSTLYLKRAKEEKIDLVTAGRIIYMAWKVLKMQSDELVEYMEREKNLEEETFGWDDLPIFDDWNFEGDFDYAKMIIKHKEKLPFVEPIRHKSDRRVTLIELINAFDQARKEAERYQLLEKLRREERERLNILAKERMKGRVHEETIEKDIKKIWKKIQQYNGKTIPLRKLYKPTDRDSFITAIMSILFLAYENKIRIYQRKFPYGEIYVKNNGG